MDQYNMCAMCERSLAKFNEQLLPLYSQLTSIDTAGQCAFSILLANDRNIDIIGSIGDGSWISRMVLKHMTEIELDIMRVLNKDNLAEIMRSEPDDPCLYSIHREDLEKVEASTVDLQGQSEEFKRWGRSEVYDINLLKRTKIIQIIHEIALAATMIRRVIPVFVSEGKSKQSWFEMFHHLSARLANMDEALKEQDRWFSECYLHDAVQIKGELHGPAMNVNVSFLINEEREELNANFDFVIAFHLQEWPEDLQLSQKEWVSRKRHWPTRCIVQKALKQGCQLVPKPLKSKYAELPSQDNNITHWRLTFTKAEREMAQARTKPQRLVYVMTKCLHYSYLKIKIGESEFPSYALKTAMMWLLEKTPSGNWTEEAALLRVRDLLKEVENALQTGHLSHYFIPRINIIGDLSQEVRQATLKKLREVSQDLPGHLTGLLDEDCKEWLIALIHHTKSAQDAMTEILGAFLPKGSEDIVMDIGKQVARTVWWKKLAPALKQRMVKYYGEPSTEQLDAHWHFPDFIKRHQLTLQPDNRPAQGTIVIHIAQIFAKFFKHLQDKHFNV